MDDFRELSESELASLSADAREAYDRLAALSPEERVMLASQSVISQTAMELLEALLVVGGLSRVWTSHLHPELRVGLVRRWAEANRPGLVADGYAIDDIVAALLGPDGFEHPLWRHLERAQIKSATPLFPEGLEHFGTSSQLRPVGVDMALVYVLDKRSLADGEIWMPGEAIPVYPVALKLDGDVWKVFDLGEDYE